MSDHDHIHDAAIRGLEPVMGQTPEHPEWESLQLERVGPATRQRNQWLVGVAAATLVLIVGAGIMLGGRIGGVDPVDPDAALVETTAATVGDAPAPASHSISGRWVLESYARGDETVYVEPGVNAGPVPWIEFNETFAGTRETFASADGQGTAGTFTGDTGCNKINHGYEVGYEYSAGFLQLEEAVVEAGECGYEAEAALLAVLWSDYGIETIRNGDTIEFYGGYRDGNVGAPLTFRWAGAPPSERPDVPQEKTGELTAAVFDVGGVEVVAVTSLDELPDRTREVEFTGTIIDAGSGPEICFGGILDSLPPQCSGPVVDGLDMAGWSEEAQGVRWGDRTIVVTWPQIDGHVQLISDSEPVRADVAYPPGQLPAACSGIARFVSTPEIHDYAQALGVRNGGVYLTNDGFIVLQVVGDPQKHRDALASDGREACVIEVERSEVEQLRIQSTISDRHEEIYKLVGSFSTMTGAGGRVDIGVGVVDRATVEAIAAFVDDPTALRIIARGILLAGD